MSSLNLPNALTLLRIFLVPVLVAVLLTRKTREGLLLGMAIFGLAVLTDYLDGWLARRRNQVTRLGMLLDPIADKLITTAAFLSLVELDAAPAWLVFIIIGREIAVTGLRQLGDARGLPIPASWLGKGKMASQVVAIFLLLLARLVPALWWPAQAALWIAVALALLSAADYFRRFGSEALRAPVSAAPPDRRR
jgi:CDP-diacylglycerol--glycerol-3-phosphate 3-phosphatidyltransferase